MEEAKREGLEDYFEGKDWEMGCMTLGIPIEEGRKRYSEWLRRRDREFGEGIDGQVARVMESIRSDINLDNMGLVDKVTMLEKLYKVGRLSKGESTENISLVNKVLMELGV